MTPINEPARGVEAGRQARRRHGRRRRGDAPGLRRRRGDRPQPRRPRPEGDEAHLDGRPPGRPAGDPDRRGERLGPPPDHPPRARLHPRVGGGPGRPKELPDDLFADRGYDSEGARDLLRWLGIEPHIAGRRTPHGGGLGKVRWVVERTISWMRGLRRMRVRYDRLQVVREAWATLAACVICYRLLHDELPAAG